MLCFSAADLERSYAQETHARNSQRDLVCFQTWILMHFIGFAVLVAHFATDRGMDAGVLLALCKTVLPGLAGYLVPIVAQRHGLFSYSVWRNVWVIGFRLASVVAASPVECLAQLHSEAGIQASPGRLPFAVVFGAQLPRSWVFTLGMPVEFGTHLLLQSILSLDVVAGAAPRLCQTPYIKNPTTLLAFKQAASRMSSWAGALLASAPGQEGLEGQADEAPSVAHCHAVVSFTHLLLGFIIPTLVLLVWERQRSVQFLIEQLGSRQAPSTVSAAVRAGLPPCEALQVCTYDALTDWLLYLALLPALAAALWLAAQSMSLAWFSGELGPQAGHGLVWPGLYFAARQLWLAVMQ